MESGIDSDEMFFIAIFSSFRAVQGGVFVTPGCTGGYSYAALSEPVHEKYCNLKKFNSISMMNPCKMSLVSILKTFDFIIFLFKINQIS
jgi:hypothetical protein